MKLTKYDYMQSLSRFKERSIISKVLHKKDYDIVISSDCINEFNDFIGEYTPIEEWNFSYDRLYIRLNNHYFRFFTGDSFTFFDLSQLLKEFLLTREELHLEFEIDYDLTIKDNKKGDGAIITFYHGWGRTENSNKTELRVTNNFLKDYIETVDSFYTLKSVKV